jgi:radical SAM superfamily enzyme YgiQ (UPF0313 family)
MSTHSQSGRRLHVKFILPALTEARSPDWRPIKYALFPPLGLATLAGYLADGDTAEIQDEHVAPLTLDDEPDLVAIQVYVTSANRAYEIADQYRARGVPVVLGGLHVTALPDEAARHADTLVLGPAEEAWPRYLDDIRYGRTKPIYRSRSRTLHGMPPVRRDLIDRQRYLVPNAIVVSRGCPHACDFCYKEAFYEGGRSYYTQAVDKALATIEAMPGRHLFFLDDHLFGNKPFAAALFDGMRGMGRVWQAAATVPSLLDDDLLDRAVACGLRSLFIGFETLSGPNLTLHHKVQNRRADYERAIRRLHDRGVMINGSFIFGLDHDTPDVFPRTVDWAVDHGIETATFHILTPYPGTALYTRMVRQGRLLHRDWDRYDTRHAVFVPEGMSPKTLELGYRRAYRDFYRWRSIARSANTKPDLSGKLRHLAYTAGWKKFEGFWNAVIRAHQVHRMVPVLEWILGRSARRRVQDERRSRPLSRLGRAER